MGITLVVLAGAAALAWGVVIQAGSDAVRFEVVDQRTEQVLHHHEVEDGASFTLEHTHSVTKRLVRETFSVQDGPLIAIEELWFDEPGPNLPAGAEPLGDGMTTFLHEDGAFRVLHHGYPIGTIPLLVGSENVDHVLNFANGERIALLDLASPGTPVELRVR